MKKLSILHSATFRKLLIASLMLSFLLLVLSGCFSRSHQNGAPKPPRGYPNFTLMKIAYVIGLVKLVDRKPEVPESIVEYKDLEYKRVGDRSLKLDIYKPKQLTAPAPVLIFIHGGGWSSGDKADYLLYLIDFAKRGYITASLSYRLSPQVRFPSAVLDVKCAVRWLKTHAHEYGIDPNKMAVIGGSAGGHLSMMIGYSADVPELAGECDADSISSRVQAVVNLYGPTDLTTDFAISRPTVHRFIGASYEAAPEQYVRASPVTYITADDPPTLIFHGTIDDIVPVRQSDLLKKKLDEVGVPNEYHRLKGWPHTMDAAKSVNKYCQYYMTAFFAKYLPLPQDTLTDEVNK